MTEEWRATHHPDYEVSNLGRVRSYAKRSGRGRYAEPHLLKPNLTGEKDNNYPTVRVAGQMKRVHRLVAAAFLGPCPEGQEVMHKDDDRMNARGDNLEYGTRSRNLQDSVLRGRYNGAARSQRGERNGNAVISSDDVRAIRRLRARGLKYGTIALLRKIPLSTVGRVVRGERWVHVK